MKKITEIEIIGEARQRLEQAKASLQSAFDEHSRARARLDEVVEKKQQVASDIEILQLTFDPVRDGDVAKLATKRQQLELLEREHNKANAAFGPVMKEIDRQGRGAASALRDAVQPFYREHLDEVAKVFEPFYENPQRARYAAGNCDQLTAMSNRLAMLRGEPGTAGDVMERINKTLDGDMTWLTGNGAK